MNKESSIGDKKKPSPEEIKAAYEDVAWLKAYIREHEERISHRTAVTKFHPAFNW